MTHLLSFLAGCIITALIMAFIAGAGRNEARATEADLEHALHELEATGQRCATLEQENATLRQLAERRSMAS